MKDHNKTGHSRRDFIRSLSVWAAATAGILASLSLLRQFFPRLDMQNRRLRVGRRNDFPVNTFSYLPEQQLYIYRDHEGIRAVSATCTHLGCIVERTEEGFICPCHGSSYDSEGRILSGAAPRDLSWYAMLKDADGQLVVDRGKPAEPDDKLYL